jgi:hypothetical protein
MADSTTPAAGADGAAPPASTTSPNKKRLLFRIWNRLIMDATVSRLRPGPSHNSAFRQISRPNVLPSPEDLPDFLMTKQG